MSDERGERVDAVVVGGGPAGLSAALYLARYRRRVVVLDRGDGRWTHHQCNRNYLGFPGGVTARELRARGRAQVTAYPEATVLDGTGAAAVTRQPDGEGFDVRGDDGRGWHAGAVVLCTGVDEDLPDLAGIDACLGRSLFWCLTCDGYELAGRRVVVTGSDDLAAREAVQLTRFAAEVVLVGRGEPLGPRLDGALAAAGVRVVEGPVAAAEHDEGVLHGLRLADGTDVAAEAWFHAGHARPRSGLAADLGARRDPGGWIAVSTEQRTTVEGCYAAGDVTRLHSHQVATAVHEGAQAASAVHADLA